MTIITKAHELDVLCDEIDAGKRCALDLEFIPERTYEPVLCLVQVATDSGAYIVDPLVLTDLNNLWRRVCSDEILVVLHAANQDLELVHGLSGLIPQNVFDTQIAAGFAGFGYPIGYGKLLNQLLGVSIAKTESFTDWTTRPLTSSQVEYAVEDVVHLLPIYERLCQKLDEQGRLSWAREECQRYVDPERYQRDRGMDFLRVKGASALNRRGLAVLQALCEWRDNEARRVDRPPKSILSDNILIELARRPPKELSDIQRIRGIRPDQVRGLGNQLLKSVQKGLATPEESCPFWPSSKIPPKREVLVADMLFAILKVISYEVDLATELIATRDELQAMVRIYKEGKIENCTLPIMQGWRRNIAGQRLLDALSGAPLTVTVNAEQDPPIIFS